MSAIHIRDARRADAALVLTFIRELAEYEKLLHELTASEEALAENLFGPAPCAEALIGEIDGRPEGFALYFRSYSTFVGKPGIYLEDLYVRPAARGLGLGKALLKTVARRAVERGCGRLEWSVLNWNEPAIQFYRSLGAEPMDEWTVQRVSGETLAQLGSASEESSR
jgi:GNAT superfamily N-acetyltransferase